jgi:hypothetical protein
VASVGTSRPSTPTDRPARRVGQAGGQVERAALEPPRRGQRLSGSSSTRGRCTPTGIRPWNPSQLSTARSISPRVGRETSSPLARRSGRSRGVTTPPWRASRRRKDSPSASPTALSWRGRSRRRTTVVARQELTPSVGEPVAGDPERHPLGGGGPGPPCSRPAPSRGCPPAGPPWGVDKPAILSIVT